MPVRVAINGFGRIGRNVLRAIAEAGRRDILVAVSLISPRLRPTLICSGSIPCTGHSG